MRRCLPVLLALPLLVGFGVAEGLWSHRWLNSRELELAVARLRQIPMTVDQWDGTDQELDPRQVARAEMGGYVMRQFVHRQTGARVLILLVAGPPGPTSVHSPDVCYQGAGYAAVGPEKLHPITIQGLSAVATFKVCQFDKRDPVSDPLRIFWSWSATGEWQAPDNPRLRFAHHSALYKLYVIRHEQNAEEPSAEDPSLEFMAHFLPKVQESLFAAP
jgi:hypothetical protein